MEPGVGAAGQGGPRGPAGAHAAARLQGRLQLHRPAALPRRGRRPPGPQAAGQGGGRGHQAQLPTGGHSDYQTSQTSPAQNP